jgi:peptide/nickel transport system substrate-binding protein
MPRRSARVAVVLVAALALAGCTATQSSVVDESVIDVGLDVGFTGVGPASAAATSVDLGVGAATLSGFSYANADGARIADIGFGTAELISAAPLVVRFTVSDGLVWSDGVGIDGVDLLLDWAARSSAFPGTPFGALPDPALRDATDVSLSGDRKSVTVEYSSGNADWMDAFREPLPAHALAERAFGTVTAEAAKDEVIAAIAAARRRDGAALAELAGAWAGAYADDPVALPTSGPYRIAEVGDDGIRLVVNDRYEGPRTPSYETIDIHHVQAPADAVQALSIGALDLIQISWDETLRTVLARIGADRRELPVADDPALLVGWFHRDLEHIEPAPSGAGALWNPWAWSPYTLIEP